MIKANITCITLEQFYKNIRQQQESSHGSHYCSHHDMIKDVVKGGESYKELGVHQGASLASAILSGVKEVHLVDPWLNFYRENSILFENYASMHGVTIVEHEKSSLDESTVSEVDILMIDSIHKWKHTKEELRLHAESTKKYIVLHDTYKCGSVRSEIGPAIYDWIVDKPWKIKKEVKKNVGAIILERVEE